MKLHAFIAAAGVAIVMTACDGLWVSAGGDVDPSDYYNGYYKKFIDSAYPVTELIDDIKYFVESIVSVLINEIPATFNEIKEKYYECL